MLLQMKQLQLLTKQALPKQQDPIHLALGGSSSSEGGTSGGGIKGCLAREAYLKVAADLERTAEIVQKNASEAGAPSSRVDARLHREEDAPGRSSNAHSDGLCDGEWVGDRVQVRQSPASRFLLPHPDVHRPDSQRWGADEPELASDFLAGAKLRSDSKESRSRRSCSIHSLSSTQLDLGQCGLSQGPGLS